MVRAACSPIFTPTWVEPVKLTQSTSSASTSGRRRRAVAVDEVDHPRGEPDVVEDADELHDGEGILGRGLHDTVLPAASAGATLPAMLTMGKLYE